MAMSGAAARTGDFTNKQEKIIYEMKIKMTYRTNYNANNNIIDRIKIQYI